MIAYVYRPKRRKNGKLIVQRTYRGRYRLRGDYEIREVALNTPDKQVARVRLMELVQEIEQERAGLKVPRAQRQALERPTREHLEDYLKELKSLGRSLSYRHHMRSRMEKLVEECSWSQLRDFSTDSFTTWRSAQSLLAPKTLNEYLNYARAFLNWLVRQERIADNPLENVTKVDQRGRQVVRRAATPQELARLLAVAGPRRILYLTAAYTGLRVNELRQLVWGDVQLDATRPHLLVRASTTKNGKEAVIPVHPLLAAELRTLKQGTTNQPVFKMGSHPERAFKRDLANAGLESFDAMGRKLDFHALRKTFGTRLATGGVPQRVAQELMRHSDANLTAGVYTDATLLPTFEAVASLNWEGNPSPHMAPQEPDFCRHKTSSGDTELQAKDTPQPVETSVVGQAQSDPVREEEMVGAGRFELPTF